MDNISDSYTDFGLRRSPDSVLPHSADRLECHIPEQARSLAKQEKFLEATTCLDRIEDDDEDQFSLNLLKVECYIQLGREYKALRAIEKVKDTILNGPLVDPEILITLGHSLGNEKSFLRSIVLFRIASDIYKENPMFCANEKLDGITKCIDISKNLIAEVSQKKSTSGGLLDLLKLSTTDDAGSQLRKAVSNTDTSRLNIIILDFGIKYLNEMFASLRSVTGANAEKKILKESWSAVFIAFALSKLEDFVKGYKVLKRGVDEMEAAFGDQAGFHYVYAVLLHNLGIVLHNSKKYPEAKEVYEKAIIAKEMSLDHNGKTKEADIEETRQAIDITKQHMLLS